MPEETVRRLRRELARIAPDPEPLPPDCPRAAVALIVRPSRPDLELLLIRRAERTGDPWSGHMALPGGREDVTDPGPLHTAIREAREEVGVALGEGAVIGRLTDVRPITGAPRIAVSAWVFGVDAGTEANPNREVDLALWVPLRELLHPGASREYLHALAGGETRSFPAFGVRDHIVWGLTHRILTEFLEIARIAAGPGEKQ